MSEKKERPVHALNEEKERTTLVVGEEKKKRLVLAMSEEEEGLGALSFSTGYIHSLLNTPKIECRVTTGNTMIKPLSV